MTETAESKRIMQLECTIANLITEIRETRQAWDASRAEADEYRRVIQVTGAWGTLLQANMDAALRVGRRETNDRT